MFSKEYFQSLESSWDRLKTCEKPIFIYGMGDGAEKLLDEFDRLGIKCTGVFASAVWEYHSCAWLWHEPA